jgi:hypothetical protein
MALKFLEKIGEALLPSLFSGGAAVAAGNEAAKAAKEAAEIQAAAADRALAAFEKNAGLSQDILKESTNAAIQTIEEGRERSRKNLRDSADLSIASLTGAANDSIKTLQERKEANRGNILHAFGLQKDEINSSAIAASGAINAARESAVSSIASGFAKAIGYAEQGRDLVNKLLQDSTKDASEKLQIARAGAIAAQDRGLAAVRSDFQPFVDAGKMALADVQKLISDPNAQKEFITNNPFFDSLASNAEKRLLSNQAASGRVGSGSTQKELHNELLMLGNSLLDNTINRRMGLVKTGMDATGAVANAEIGRANTVSAIEQQTGRSLAELAAQLGVNQANNVTTTNRTLADLATGQAKATADINTNAGTQLASIETARGANVANAVGQGIDRLTNSQTQLDTAIANTQNNLGQNISGVINTTGTNIANLNRAATDATASLQSNLGVNQSNILTNQAANTADTLIGKGDAQAAGAIGQSNAFTGTIADLNKIILPTVFGPGQSQDVTGQPSEEELRRRARTS